MVKLFDSTLRDGSHVVRHQLNAEQIAQFCRAVDDAGLETVIVGHGNGLGASSINIGLSQLSDVEMLRVAKQNLKKTKLGVFLIPGYGTIHDNLEPAFNEGVDLVCIAAHCTEANVMRQHIEYSVSQGKDVYGVLMMQHTIDDDAILEQSKLIESYGAQGVVLMDSAGASLPHNVSKRVKHLVGNLSIEVGFHAHNNLGMAIANSVAAVEAGATIIDGTVRAFGAGAGNCQIELIASVLKKMNYPIVADNYLLMEAGEQIVKGFVGEDRGIDPVCIVSGLAGVFSSYRQPVLRAAKHFGVDYRDIFMELGRRKVVGGQEDMIVQVAVELSKSK